MKVKTFSNALVAFVAIFLKEQTVFAADDNNHGGLRRLQTSFCCTHNFKDCSNSAWCNAQQNRCESNCGGFWADISLVPQGCTARYQTCTDTNLEVDPDPCCPGTACVGNQYYKQCKLAPETPAPVGSTPVATPSPTTLAPIAPSPVTPAPIIPAPVTPSPITPSPITPSPVTSAPITTAPVSTTAAPITLTPITTAPITPPVTPSPVTSAPVSQQEDVFGCCSQNFKDCVSWCDSYADNQGRLTEQDCIDCNQDVVFLAGGAVTGSCLKRWDACTNNPSSCCNGLSCEGNSQYSQCLYVESATFAPTAPTPFPTPQPTLAPTSSQPSMAPIPTPTPTTAVPSQPVTAAPVGPIPNGPYITAAQSSERVTIPDPPMPETPTGANCPNLLGSLLDWHDPSTWGGSVPTSGNVVLPANSRVVINQAVTQKLDLVTVPSSSELIFGSNPVGITMDVDGMDVKGKLIAGSTECRIENPVTITLHGSRPSDAVTNIKSETYKGISVEGEISLHGKQYYRTWTRLAKTLSPGDNVILLQHPVNWEAGQEIILVTTAMKDSIEWHQNEISVIANVVTNPVAGVGAAVYLEAPVSYQHLALSNYQAEVGLLTRTIKIQGSASDSEPTDPDPKNCMGTRDIYGDRSEPCPNTELTGFGGHIIVHSGGRGFVEGVELYRMGQTNVLGRYPMHFHLLGSCPECYFRGSSVHRSFYRCVSIHGTNEAVVTENVAYDVRGFCYYLEDGVEEENVLSFNLAAHVHMILGTSEKIPHGSGQNIDLYYQSNVLTLPADVTASGFYITNVRNYIIGNAASGGWAGFAFPTLSQPLGPHKDLNFRPSNALGLEIDGNTAHSTSWWWYHTGAFYFGGALYFEGTTLVYNAGRGSSRNVCLDDLCGNGNCGAGCPDHRRAWIPVTNSKAFLAAGTGLNSWSGRLEILGFEAHDTGLALEALEAGFYISNVLAVCRTGEKIILPPSGTANKIRGDGFYWYDTNQEHIVTYSTFRNCGYRSDEFNQYNTDPTRGCGNDADTGCASRSTAFGFLTHSDQHNPEIMQGTRGITFDNCGRRFRLHDYSGNNSPSTVSGRSQNWFDADGSVTGFNVPSLIGSGLADTGLWWKVDDEVVYDSHGPLNFIKQTTGPERGLGHFHAYFDYAQHNQVGNSICRNGGNSPCPALGYIRHLGKKFSGAGEYGQHVAADADIVGPVGGFGWYMELNEGAPRALKFELIEVKPDTPMLVSIAYPLGTTFTITAYANWCSDDQYYSCSETFHRVNSISEVRTSLGNTYHFDDNTGLLTFRIIQTPKTFVGRPAWFLPNFSDIGKWGNGWALDRFERDGVLLPKLSYGPWLDVIADCTASSQNGAYCAGARTSDFRDYDPCPSGYEQVAYDKCCSTSSPSVCIFANGSTTLRRSI